MRTFREASRTQDGHLYAVLFVNGLVKIGRGGIPDRRIAEHLSEGARHGNRGSMRWVSAYLGRGLVAAERALIDWCAVQPGSELVSGNEWFMGLRYSDVIAQAERIAAGYVAPKAHPDLPTFTVAQCGTLVNLQALSHRAPLG